MLGQERPFSHTLSKRKWHAEWLGCGASPTGPDRPLAASMDCAALAVAQLEKLDECQRTLLETMRKQKVDSERAKEVEEVFGSIPDYIRKLERISSQMNALSERTAAMRVRSAKLAAEHQTLG